ncbi:HlyU family transcriptional regulator [Marinivivus vitaminiproducens]|uniref:HlyU family transcriptional regulator n=1 Tax=Marinivivus vitaminiproducens TaxID=3035935 RepID=UPI0027A32DA3|nr:HlyU family transcriptional regulator [Geminicoccaceae bacterium SCSIO 64248]
MGLGGFFRNLFGSGEPGEAKAEHGEPVEYNGFTITPAPEGKGGQYLTAGIIRKAVGDEVREHRFIRADTHSSKDEAEKFSVLKAQQIINEQGDRLFEDAPGRPAS